MIRPSFDQMGLTLAVAWSARSSDDKHQVGCVIFSNTSHTQVSSGFNGRYPGSPSENRHSGEIGGSENIHSELNALLRARWEPGETHTLYCTHLPCTDCALAILAARHVSRVVCLNDYALSGRRTGREILEEAGRTVEVWSSHGFLELRSWMLDLEPSGP